MPLFQTSLSKTCGSPVKCEFSVLTKIWELPFHLPLVEIILQDMALLLLATAMGVWKARLPVLQVRSCETSI